MGFIVYNIAIGFAFAVLLYFTGYVVGIIQGMTRWK